MSVFNIASRYANAFFQYAESNNILEKVYPDFELLENSFAQSKELRSFLSSPIIKLEKKKAALEVLFKDKVLEETWNFIEFVLKKNREIYFLEIFKQFNEIKNSKLGIIKTIVNTNFSLDDASRENIKYQLEKFTGKKVLVEHRLDENLLGGFIARFGDTIIDASFENQLKKLKKKLIENINA